MIFKKQKKQKQVVDQKGYTAYRKISKVHNYIQYCLITFLIIFIAFFSYNGLSFIL